MRRAPPTADLPRIRDDTPLGSPIRGKSALLVHRRPELTDGQDTGSLRRLVGSVESTVGFLLALIVGTAFPAVNYFAFFLLALTGRLVRPVERRLERRAR